MIQPSKFEDASKSGCDCKLNKALYGYKQALRSWYQILSLDFLDFCFFNSKSDASMFIKHHGSDPIIKLVYVDHILLTGSNNAYLEDLVQCLHNKFSLKVFGVISYFFGSKITRTKNYLFLT